MPFEARLPILFAVVTATHYVRVLTVASLILALLGTATLWLWRGG